MSSYDDYLLKQKATYDRIIADMQNAGVNPPPTDDYLPNGHNLALLTFKAGGWKKLPPQKERSIADRFKPKTWEERNKAFESYYDPEPVPESQTYFRCVDGDMQVVDGDAYTCLAVQLNEMLKVTIEEPTYDS